MEMVQLLAIFQYINILAFYLFSYQIVVSFFFYFQQMLLVHTSAFKTQSLV